MKRGTPRLSETLSQGANSSLERRYTYILSQESSGLVVRPTYHELGKWIEKLVGNSQLSGTHVKVMVGVWIVTGQRVHRAGPDGLIPVYEPILAETAGVSLATCSRSIMLLWKSNIVQRRVEWKEERKHLFLALSQQALEYPERLTLKDARNHGGLRCKHCGGELVVTELTCSGCGQVYRKRGKK